MKHIRIELKWGIIFVFAGLLWMLLERAAGLHDEYIDQHAIYTNFFAIPAIAIYVYALLDKRKNFYNGTMSYKQGFVSGMIITLIVTILAPLSQFITSTVITPHYFGNATEYVVSQGTMTQEQAMAYFSLTSYLIQATIGALIMGMVTSAVVAIFTKKNEDVATNIA